MSNHKSERLELASLAKWDKNRVFGNKEWLYKKEPNPYCYYGGVSAIVGLFVIQSPEKLVRVHDDMLGDLCINPHKMIQWPQNLVSPTEEKSPKGRVQKVLKSGYQQLWHMGLFNYYLF